MLTRKSLSPCRNIKLASVCSVRAGSPPPIHEGWHLALGKKSAAFCQSLVRSLLPPVHPPPMRLSCLQESQRGGGFLFQSDWSWGGNGIPALLQPRFPSLPLFLQPPPLPFGLANPCPVPTLLQSSWQLIQYLLFFPVSWLKVIGVLCPWCWFCSTAETMHFLLLIPLQIPLLCPIHFFLKKW